jgi:hypothetical protein
MVNIRAFATTNRSKPSQLFPALRSISSTYDAHRGRILYRVKLSKIKNNFITLFAANFHLHNTYSTSNISTANNVLF